MTNNLTNEQVERMQQEIDLINLQARMAATLKERGIKFVPGRRTAVETNA